MILPTPRIAGQDSFDRSYKAALARHLRAANGTKGGARVGRLARSLGIETLDLARIHDRVVAALAPPASSKALQTSFFSAAIAPIEDTHSGTSEALLACARLAARLGRRTGELAAARLRLVRETTRRKSLRVELDTSERHQGESLDRAKHMEDRLRRLAHRLLSAQEEERLRISRDLHDAIGQELTQINVGLAALKCGAASNSRELGTAIALTQKLVERSMNTVHHYAWELRPPVLDDLGLVPALRSYAKAFGERAGLPVGFRAAPKLPRADNHRSLALFRVAQGALSNIERHARAERVSVVLRAAPGVLRLEVKDDGRAFDALRMETARKERHLGLLVMRERVEMVGGCFSIVSAAGRGTMVRADVPLESGGGRP